MFRKLVSSLGIAVLVASGLYGMAQNQSGQKLDLNSAGQQQLESLPGIGPALAKRILAFREKNGPFKKIEDLMNVSGIGEKKFEGLKDLIRVGSAAKKSDGPNHRRAG